MAKISLPEFDIITQIIVPIGTAAGVMISIGTIAWKIRSWFKTQTQDLDKKMDAKFSDQNKKLSDQHDCIKKVEATGKVLEERTSNLKDQNEIIFNKLESVKTQIGKNTEEIAVIKTTMDAHLNPKNFQSH